MCGTLHSTTGPTNYVETYFPNQACTGVLPSTPSLCSNPVACFVNQRLYLAILVGNVMNMYVFNSATQAWDYINHSGASHTRQPFACSERCIFFMDDTTPECFDPVTTLWTYRNGPNDFTGGQSCCTYNPNDNSVYCFGGNKATVYTTGSQKYTIATDTWSNLAKMPALSTSVSSRFVQDISCNMIPGTNTLLVLQAFVLNSVAYCSCIFDCTNSVWTTCQPCSFDLTMEDIIVNGNQVYAFNNQYDGAYAYCPNSATRWQRVSDSHPLIWPRDLATTLFVPPAVLGPLVQCSSTDYVCTP